jgi:hypothetical protein
MKTQVQRLKILRFKYEPFSLKQVKQKKPYLKKYGFFMLEVNILPKKITHYK